MYFCNLKDIYKIVPITISSKNYFDQFDFSNAFDGLFIYVLIIDILFLEMI